MPIVERDLQGWTPVSTPQLGSSISAFTLTSSPTAVFKGYTYTVTFPLSNVYRVLLTGPYRPRPPHDNVTLEYQPLSFDIVSLNIDKCTARFDFPRVGETHLDGAVAKKRQLELIWRESIILNVYESDGDGELMRLLGDLPGRSYALTERGIMRHWWIERNNVHIGMGEKGAPIDLTGRSFQLHGTDAACYDAYHGDPLYKHTPFLISMPRPTPDQPLPSTYAIYHPTNSNCTWDIGRHHDDPWGYFKTFTQDWGGLEEWVMVGKSVKEVLRTFAEIVGRPKLVGRDWLGYLGTCRNVACGVC